MKCELTGMYFKELKKTLCNSIKMTFGMKVPNS